MLWSIIQLLVLPCDSAPEDIKCQAVPADFQWPCVACAFEQTSSICQIYRV